MIDLDKLQALEEKATPGPWEATEPNSCGDDDDILQSGVDVPGGSLTWDDHNGEVFKPEDARFIAEARQAVPELIRAVKELAEENGHLREKYDADMAVLKGKIQAVLGEPDAMIGTRLHVSVARIDRALEEG